MSDVLIFRGYYILYISYLQSTPKSNVRKAIVRNRKSNSERQDIQCTYL